VVKRADAMQAAGCCSSSTSGQMTNGCAMAGSPGAT